jgi:DNA-binding response OmpR family regulator
MVDIATSRPADRPRCLIVEDRLLIALSIEAYLDEMGFGSEGPFRSGGDALAWLKTRAPQAAILDYDLADGACDALACELQRRNIPFVIYSGYRPTSALPPELRDVPWLKKPCTRDELLQALQSVLDRSRC